MLKRSVYETIKKGLVDGIYKSVRLVKLLPNGDRQTMIPFTMQGSSIARLEHIKLQLDKKLSAGTYIIECRTGNNNTTHIDGYEVIIKEPVTLSLNSEGKTDPVIDATQDQENMQQIELEDYLKIVRENADLKAQVKVLEMQQEFYKEFIAPLKNGVGLSDNEPRTTTDKILNTLSENIPVIASIFDKVLSQKDKSLELKERELNIKQGIKTKPVKAMNQKLNPDDVVNELEELYYKDQELFNKALDQLSIENPELYEYACTELGIEDDNEESE